MKFKMVIPREKMLTVRVSEEFDKDLMALAKKWSLTKSEITRLLLDIGLRSAKKVDRDMEA